ncbi:ABC transporter substrate-binding protein [Hungatella hathewayi]|uniref:ABC transporter substrate-binding protein n=1 Tax=Hungatella hathewayi TaxID=154046 RepID=UPI00356A4BA8
MRRITALCLAAGMCGALLAGCQKTAQQADTRGETVSAASEEQAAEKAAGTEETTEAVSAGNQVTIKMATWDYTSNKSVSNAIAAFEAKNPNIKVEVIDIPSTDYNTKLNVMLNGGSELDTYFIKDAPLTYDLYKKGQMVDLTDRIAADIIDMSGFNGTDKPFNIDGKQYAMPVRTDYYVVYYNKDLFDKAGVAYPSNDMTWEEFAELARQVTSEGVYGAHFHTWQTQVMNWGVQDGVHTTMDYETGYDFFKPYYDMVINLQEDGVIQDFGTLKSANIHYSSAFQAGNVAMMPMGTWYMTTLTEAIRSGDTEVKNWGVATLPHPADVEAGYTVGSATPLVINPTSKKQDAVWEFIKFMSGEEGAAEYAKVGAMPGRVQDSMLAEIASLDGMPEGLMDALKVKNIVADRPIGENVSEVDTMLTEEHGLILLGELTVEEGLAEMAERSKEIQER